MATVTAPQLVSTPLKTTLFMCRRSDLRLVKVPRYPQFGIGGQKVGEQPGEAVQFRNGRLDVPEKGPMTLDDGRTADSQEILAWLKSHPLLGNVEEGLWVVDQMAPPVSEEELDMLLEHSLDVDMLRAIIDQEENGWARDGLLRPARKQLERCEETLRLMAEEKAEREATEAEAEAAAAKAKPTKRPPQGS